MTISKTQLEYLTQPLTEDTEFFIHKSDLELILRTFNYLLQKPVTNEFTDSPLLNCMDKEYAEHLTVQISSTLNRSTRKNWQLVKYNDPSSGRYGRHPYSHYGTYPAIREEKYPFNHTVGKY